MPFISRRDAPVVQAAVDADYRDCVQRARLTRSQCRDEATRGPFVPTNGFWSRLGDVGGGVASHLLQSVQRATTATTGGKSDGQTWMGGAGAGGRGGGAMSKVGGLAVGAAAL